MSIFSRQYTSALRKTIWRGIHAWKWSGSGWTCLYSLNLSFDWHLPLVCQNREKGADADPQAAKSQKVLPSGSFIANTSTSRTTYSPSVISGHGLEYWLIGRIQYKLNCSWKFYVIHRLRMDGRTKRWYTPNLHLDEVSLPFTNKKFKTHILKFIEVVFLFHIVDIFLLFSALHQIVL